MNGEQGIEAGVDVAGVDVGLTLVNRTSGVCRTGTSGDFVDHTYCDYLSRVSALGLGHLYAVLAIDGPILPVGKLHYEVRSCEKAFVWGAFQRRCKPGESQIPGTGQALRRGGVETAHTFRNSVRSSQLARPIPHVFGNWNIVEAFPHGFLGVSLSDDSYAVTPARHERFDKRGTTLNS